MASLLDSIDSPTLSLLGNIASAGRLGRPDVPVYGMTEEGAPLPNQMSGTQQGQAFDALLSFGSALANASAPRFGPAPTFMQGLTDALSAGRGQVINEQLAQAQAADMALRRRILEQQLQGQQLIAQWLVRSGINPEATAKPPETPSATPPGYTPGAGVQTALKGAEGGPRGYGAVNAGGYSGAYQIGAQLAKDAGFYEPAEGENVGGNVWGGQFKIPGFAQVKTRDDFLKNPAAQDAAYTLAMGHNDQQLQALGVYDRALGQVIGGVPVTRDGLLAGAWLGGPGGVKAWVDSGGKEDRKDANGTRISDYVRLGSNVGADPKLAAPYQVATNGPIPPPSAPAAPPGTVAYPGAPDAPVAPGAGLPTAATPAQLAAAPAPPPLVAPQTPGAAVPSPAAPGAGAPPAPVPAPGAAPPAAAPGAAPPALRVSTGPLAPQAMVLPAIPGMNRSALDNMPPRDRQLLGVSLMSMPPGKWPGIVAQLAMKPGEAPQITTIGGDQVAVYRDGTRVVLGPARQEPFNIERVDDGGNLHNIRIDPNRGTEQDLGIKGQVQLEDFQQNGVNYRGYRRPDGTKVPVMQAPIPPGSQPLTPQAQQQHLEQAQAQKPTAEDIRAQEEGKATAKAQADLSTAGDTAANTLQTLRRFRSVAEGFQSGRLAPTAATVGSVGLGLGLDLGGFASSMSGRAVTQAEILQKIGNELVKSQIAPGSGFTTQLSDTDRQFLEKTMPNISNRPESNAVILAFLESAAQRTIDKAQAWDARDDRSGPAWRRFNNEWRGSQNKDPIIHDVPSTEEALKLPVGTVVRLPDGYMSVVRP